MRQKQGILSDSVMRNEECSSGCNNVPEIEGTPMAELKRFAESTPTLTEGIKVLMKKLFTPEELVKCSVLGQQSSKSLENRPPLDEKKWVILEGLLIKRFDTSLATLRMRMRDRIKLFRKAYNGIL
ncbi:uncharacterized protein LOC117336291 [Pecten maximus]|uniref:uncharacterized protein LOC117336291 n=1 Tax=Pecten maximus TaxID=6579 RepID=UPI0014585B35|nr:uncharacterized protein LOC117336291 [Pecten maximus]